MKATQGGKVQLLVLPGLDGTGDLLLEFTDLLRETFAVRTISYPSDRHFSYPDLAESIAAQWDADGRVVLIAESFAGPLATMLAVRYPGRVAGIVYVASFVSNPRPCLGLLTALAKRASFKTLIRLPGAMLPLFGAWGSRASRVKLSAVIARNAKGVLGARLGAVLQSDYRREFGELNIPLMYLQPTSDRLVPKSVAREMARANTRLSITQIDGPHFVLQTHARPAADCLGPFLRQFAADSH